MLNAEAAAAYLVPKFTVESKVDVEVLVMVVMEDAIRLPRLHQHGNTRNNNILKRKRPKKKGAT